MERVKEVLKHFESNGIGVQDSKYKWFQKSVKYLGNRIDESGIHPATEHLEAMKKMPSLKNAKELRSFLGSINCYSKFVPHLQSLCVLLHKLLREEEKWHWTEKYEQI
jgi:transposase-like protein